MPVAKVRWAGGCHSAMNVTGTKDLVSTTQDDETVAEIDRELMQLFRRTEAIIAKRPMTDRLVRSGYLLMSELERSGSLGIAALADATQVDISTASRQIAPLERQGLIRRLPNPADGRGSLIEITLLGLDRLRATREERHATLLELLRDWLERDRAAFASYLARLNQAIADR
jgi:DNA-binding MarR family transcriptional regulator